MNRFACTLCFVAFLCGTVTAADPIPTEGFKFAFTTKLDAAPGVVWDAMTGDISQWWDHTMSDDPVALEIQARPGGYFLERFNDEGDGVVHAVVTYAETDKKLRMEGAMGLAGNALTLVTTLELKPAEWPGTTQLTVTVHGSGEVYEGWPQVVEDTWHHFIDDRLAPFVAGDLKD